MSQESQKYDFVIIGSGISGLVTATILAKNGYKVIVLEKNHQIGGAMQVFSRDKCVFDTGVHYIGGMDEGENLHCFFSYLGILDDLKLHPLDREAFDIIGLSNGLSVKHGQGYDNFRKGLVEAFPNESNAIDQFCDKIQEMCNYFPLYNLRLEGEKTYLTNPEIVEIGAWDYVSSITENNDLKIALLGSGLLYAGDAKTTPLYVVALIMNSFIKGSYRLVDGGSQIAKLLVKKIRSFGGEVLKHKEITSMSYHDNKLISEVVCADGTSYRADNFISSIHPNRTVEIAGEEHFFPAFVRRIKSLKNTVSSFTVHLSLKPGTFNYINNNFYDYYVEDGWNIVDYKKEDWPQLVYACTPISSKNEHFAESLALMAYMNIDELDEWKESFNTIADKSERGDRYKQFKKEKEEQIIERIEKRFPNIRESILNVYSSTPLTFKDYLGTPEGELYGVIKDFNNPEGTIINTRTKVKNLYLTGQNIVFHGILGATVGAFVTSFNFLDNNKIIQEVRAYEKAL